jgi:cytochrome c oxidase accessory protein FixG
MRVATQYAADGCRPVTPTDAYTIPATHREAAPGVVRHNVDAVNRAEERQLYADRQRIYPKLAHGRFRALKWLVMGLTLGIYYGLPWLRWHRGPDLPDQAVLLDIANNRFFFFFLEIWPQEFYFVTGLLVLAALTLFLLTSLAGRVWCGYACPQTVWTDLMVLVERFWQGDRNARLRLDKEKWGPRKLCKKAMTHASWLVIAALTGGALVFYFRDAPTLAVELVTGSAPAIAYLFLGIFSASTYLLGGIAREQVCIYMCPWPRIQGAMVDQDTLLISYRNHRGEPRGPHKKGQSWEHRGDCIDCKACVAVCPTGIDIRDGSQLECIQCALCIDACNDIMSRIGRPRNLIAYDTIAGQRAAANGLSSAVRLLRTRTLLYGGLIALVAVIMLAALLLRSTVEINILHDRNPPFVLLSDGSVRNAYTVKILNKMHEPRVFSLSTQGLPGALLTIVGGNGGGNIRVGTDDLREVRVLVTVPVSYLARQPPTATTFAMIVTDVASRHSNERTTHFQR